MPEVLCDVRELTADEPELTGGGAAVWYSPYRPYTDTDGGVTYRVDREQIKLRLVDGKNTATLPVTPVGEALRVSLRGVSGESYPFYVQIPDTDEPVHLFALPRLDPDTLDPETPLQAAWVEGLEGVQADVATTADGLDTLTQTVAGLELGAASDTAVATQVSAGTATPAAIDARIASGITGKADTSALTAGLATKADATTTTAALATKTDTTSAGRDALAVADYAKLRPFFADLANWRNKRVDIAFYGDSNPEGFALANWDHTAPAQLAAMLRTRHGITTGARGFIGIQNDLVNKPFWPMTYTSVPGANITATGYGTNARQVGLTATGQRITFTVASPITSFYIHYAQFGTGTFYYKIDGGANVNVVANGTATIVPTRVLVNTPVNTSIEIGWVSGASYIAGIQTNKGDETSGLQVHNLGWSGSWAKSWNDRTVATWQTCGAVLAPSLIVVNLGGNDGRASGGNRTAAQFQTDLTTFFTNLNTVSTTAPIVMNMQWNLGDAALLEPWANYVAAARAACASSSRAVLVDHSGTATTGRMYGSDGADPLALYNAASLPHATAKGYALYAATLTRALEPR